MTEIKDNGSPVLGSDLTALPKDKLAEGILKMMREHGYPHVMLTFADEKGAYWTTHTGTYQIYRLHRLLGVVLDEVQVRLDAPPAPAVAAPPEDPEP